ncbi:type II secretion system protein GspD [Sphingomonas sp. URHD0057]|uniref:type II secretion system protein GspD n=1 Tax=Sphingomonas sp. URHD0057 TaxID=1380389 RepID=UPI000AD3B3A3|nr:secretin N-terminal domain-containing protein [Sphingomonas sp. URHD0057]
MTRFLLLFEPLSRAIAAHVAVAFLLLFAAPAVAAAAQTRPQPVPVALTNVRLLSESADESRFELAFDPTATSFAPIASQPTQPSIGFALASRGPHAVQPSGMKGLVRGISFEQADTVLIMRFAVGQAASLSAVQTGGRTVEITVTTGKAAAKDYGGAGAPAAAGGLPPAYAPAVGEDGYELVLLKYADVSEVVGLLTDGLTVKSNDVFIPSEPGFGSNSLTGQNYNPQPSAQAPGGSDEPLGQSVDASMGIDRRLNAIWLKGSPDRIARMKQMISRIDIPVDSVVIETQFVELTERGEKALGIDFANANGQIGLVTFHSGEAVIPGVVQGCNADGSNCSGHVTSAGFQAALYAQISKGNGRIVSRPRIAAQSGSTAKIITGDAIPILTAITLSGVNGVSQQVQYVNVGVTLQIAPRVSGDGFVSSHVFCVVSSVTGVSQGYPTISQREAETSATVRDGDSFVIGGLTQDENTTTKTKVPLLGDLPIVGQAFRTDRSTKIKTELYIVVTPRIVHRVGTRPGIVPANAPLYAPTTQTTIPIAPEAPPQR